LLLQLIVSYLSVVTVSSSSLSLMTTTCLLFVCNTLAILPLCTRYGLKKDATKKNEILIEAYHGVLL